MTSANMSNDHNLSLTEMTFDEKIEMLRKEREALGKKAVSLVGRQGADFLNIRAQYPIAKCIEKGKVQHIVVFPVKTAGAPCVVLSSRLYPEVGLLIWDADYGSTRIRFAHCYQEMQFGLVCCCCSPHTVGVPFPDGTNDDEYWEHNRKPFVDAVRQTCKRAGVTKLYFPCSMSSHCISLKQDVDGLHFLDAFIAENVDRWRFAAAFAEIVIGKESSPFADLLKARAGESTTKVVDAR